MSRKTKNLITYGLIIAITFALVAVFSSATGGFTERDPENWNFRNRNEDNLFDNASYTIDEGTTRHESGINVTVDKYGVITLNGSNIGTSAVTIEIGALSLDEGEYTFTTSNNKTSTVKAYLKYQTTGGTYEADFGGTNGTFTLSANATGAVMLVVAGETEFNNFVLKPVVVAGDEAGDFFK